FLDSSFWGQNGASKDIFRDKKRSNCFRMSKLLWPDPLFFIHKSDEDFLTLRITSDISLICQPLFAAVNEKEGNDFEAIHGVSNLSARFPPNAHSGSISHGSECNQFHSERP
ncbi:MAG: hypothetical protein WBE11_10370, partial [Candidatus Aminicenantaceae bacterium]